MRELQPHGRVTFDSAEMDVPRGGRTLQPQLRADLLMRIGIFTGGGDVPGLNACIRSVVLSADALGWEVVGFRRGWEGVMRIDPADPASIAAHSIALTREGVRGIDRTGGTILHTSRRDPRTETGRRPHRRRRSTCSKGSASTR